jgi:hypothetical protein
MDFSDNMCSSVREHQLRSLLVAKVSSAIEIAPLPRAPKRPLLGSKHAAKHKHVYTPTDPSSNQGGRLLLLTCDHIALLRTAPAADDPDGSPPSSRSSSSSSLGEQAFGMALALSQVAAVRAAGAVVSLAYHQASFAEEEAQPGLAGLAGLTGLWSRQAWLLGLFPSILDGASNKARGPRDVDGGPDGSAHLHTLRLRTDTPAEAAQLAAAILGAMRRLTEALLWLDRGLPADRSLQLVVVSADRCPAGGGEPSCQAVLARAPPWGAPLALPADLMALQDAGAGGSAASAPPPSLHFDLSTPLGPCHVALPLRAVAAAARGGGGYLDATVRLRGATVATPPAAHDEVQLPDKGVGTAADQFAVRLTCAVAALPPAPLALASGPEAAAALPPLPGKLASWQLALAVGCAMCVAAALLPVCGPALALAAAAAALAAGAWALGRPGAAAAPAAAAPPPQPASLHHSVTPLRAELVQLGATDETEEADAAPYATAQEESGALEPAPEALPPGAASARDRLRRTLTRGAAAAGDALVDIGAVSFQRAVLSTSAAEGAAGVRPPAGAGGGGAAEAEGAQLAALAARSPVATRDLLERYVVACAGDRGAALQRLRDTVVRPALTLPFARPGTHACACVPSAARPPVLGTTVTHALLTPALSGLRPRRSPSPPAGVAACCRRRRRAVLPRPPFCRHEGRLPALRLRAHQGGAAGGGGGHRRVQGSHGQAAAAGCARRPRRRRHAARAAIPQRLPLILLLPI